MTFDLAASQHLLRGLTQHLFDAAIQEHALYSAIWYIGR